MRFRHHTILLLVLTTIMLATTSCQNATPPPPQSPVSPVPAAPVVPQGLPVLPPAVHQHLMTNTTSLDYLPLFFGQSLSINAPNEAPKHVMMILQQPQLNQNCEQNAFAKFSFYDKDKNVLREGDIYFVANCTYYVFYDEKGQPQYASKMADSGILFFNNVIKNLQKSQ